MLTVTHAIRQTGVLPMSKIDTIEIECPECKEKQPTTVWHSLNSSLDPEDKELLLAGKINREGSKGRC
jgi:hypothetical protein